MLPLDELLEQGHGAVPEPLLALGDRIVLIGEFLLQLFQLLELLPHLLQTLCDACEPGA